jgi:site-specific recombinase XerD
VGSVSALPARAAGVRLADAVRIFLGTIVTANTRRAYASALDRMVRDFGADGDVGLLNPDRVSGWFDYVWGDKSPKTYNLRLTAVSAACAYWRDQEWLTGDPVSRLRARPTAPDNSKAMTTAEVDELLGMDAAALRERVFWSMLYESAARAEEILNLDIEDLDTVNRCATVLRKGGAAT